MSMNILSLSEIIHMFVKNVVEGAGAQNPFEARYFDIDLRGFAALSLKLGKKVPRACHVLEHVAQNEKFCVRL